jgi:hypothetical protein
MRSLIAKGVENIHQGTSKIIFLKLKILPADVWAEFSYCFIGFVGYQKVPTF